jgi:hypothetical protein
VRDVVGLEIDGRRPPIARREVLEQLDARARRGPKRGDAQPRSKHVVQVLLFRVVVLALARDPHAEHVAIEPERPIRVGDDDGGVVDAEKQAIGAVPLLEALACREVQDFEKVAVRVAEVERADAARIRVPGGQ